VLHELGAAWALNKPIIPIVITPQAFSKIPVTLGELQSVEIEDLENPEVIDQILEVHEKANNST